MTTFSNLSIQTKILASLGLMAALCLFIAGFGAHQITTLNGVSSRLITDQAESMRIAAVANQDAIDLQQETLQWILASDPGEGPAWRAKITKSVSAMNEKLEQLKPFINGPDVARFKVIESNFAIYRAGFAPLDQIMARNDRKAAEHQMDRVSTPAYERMDTAYTALVEQQRIDLAAGRAQMAATGVATWWTLIIVALSGLVILGSAILVMVRAQIATPIRAITASMGRLAGGDTAIELSGTERRDEVGDMSRAVIVFRDAARALDLAQAEKARLDAEQRLVVDTLEGALTTLAAGDVSNDIGVSFPAEYSGVKTNFNAALANLRGLIGGVTESADGIRTGSQEIAQASEDLARRTESNAASLEETSAALVQIDTRLKATALSSGQTVVRADQAIAAVGGGRATAEEAVQAMGRVSDSAKGIDSVIEGLDKIAFQTRVLAMNAAVEAGRAGDAGRGFAVVADLVSALAMRAEEEAKRARDQLTLTQTDIVTAVHAVQRVDGALVNISSDVGEVHALLGTMADDAAAQSSAITQISAAIGAMDQSTQQNAAMVEETSAAARNLTAEVTSLTKQTAMFKTDEAVPVHRASPAPAPSRHAKAKPAAAAPAAPRKAPPAMAARASNDASDDWNAF